DKMDENTIPEYHYAKIEENSTRLKSPTAYDIIIYKFDHEFLINHKNRRKLDSKSEERLTIERKNRKFLEEYHKVYELITYWYGYYLNQGIADKGIAGAQLRYAFLLIENKTIKDIQAFINYLNQSAENGNNIAQYNLGNIYYFGKFKVPVDKEKEKSPIQGFSKDELEEKIIETDEKIKNYNLYLKKFFKEKSKYEKELMKQTEEERVMRRNKVENRLKRKLKYYDQIKKYRK
ncbi:8154_t:CDS:2, partial [Racocetra fulgida]